MALTHTILAVLSHNPCSGYDLSKRFDEGVSCFWKASQQQIYRELGKLEQQGLVRHEKIPQDGKPDKKLYHMTPAGKAELARWFTEPTEPTPIREDLLVKVLVGPHFPQELLAQELRQRCAMHQQKLALYREKEALYQAMDDPTPEEQFRYLTLRRGIRYEEDWIAWCEEVQAFLRQYADQ